MLRDPAIHIRRSDLLRICKEEGITFPDEFVAQLMLKASKVKINNRIIITAKSKACAKAARTTATKDEIVNQFNRVYDSALKNHHIKAAVIRKGSKAYLTLKEVATNAYDFSQAYKIQSLEDAFKLYVGVGIILLDKKFSIYRMKGSDQRIRTRYENMELLTECDQLKMGEMRNAWDRSLKNFHDLGMTPNIDQMADIVHAVVEADKSGAKYTDWMDAQFDKWTYLDSMPEFSQLHGDNAVLAYTKYMAGQKSEFANDGERQHFETLKNEKEIPIKTVKRQGSKDQS